MPEHFSPSHPHHISHITSESDLQHGEKEEAETAEEHNVEGRNLDYERMKKIGLELEWEFR